MPSLLTVLGRTFDAYLECEKRGNWEWQDKHELRIIDLCYNFLPSGSGFDCGSKLDFDASKPERLVFTTSFHHMDEFGGYCGWSHHDVIAKPSLVHGFTLRITGRDRREIKSYIHEMFDYALSKEIPYAFEI